MKVSRHSWHYRLSERHTSVHYLKEYTPLKYITNLIRCMFCSIPSWFGSLCINVFIAIAAIFYCALVGSEITLVKEIVQSWDDISAIALYVFAGAAVTFTILLACLGVVLIIKGFYLITTTLFNFITSLGKSIEIVE